MLFFFFTILPVLIHLCVIQGKLLFQLSLVEVKDFSLELIVLPMREEKKNVHADVLAFTTPQ